MVETDDNKVVLERKITLMNGVGIIVGTIIGEDQDNFKNLQNSSSIFSGSGIFLSPSGVYQYSE